MFPILKSLLSYVTGQESSRVSQFDDEQDLSLIDKPNDETVPIMRLGEEERELEEYGEDHGIIEILEKEIKVIEGWEQELKDAKELKEGSPAGEETDDTNAESCVHNSKQDICEKHTSICIADSFKNEFQQSCKRGPELCEHRLGTITELFRNYGIIDKELRFDRQNCKIGNLSVGASVNYVVFRKTVEETWQMHKILAITDENWEENKKETKTEVVKKSGAIDRKMIGQVESKKGREIFVKPNIRFCLDDVESDFLPYIGDWLSINALVELDESIQDFVGDVLAVYGIEPLRNKVISGTVTSWNENRREGIIDKNVWFTQNECEPGFVPSLEDSVVVQAIESTQGACSWRALNVVSLSENKESKIKAQTLYREERKKVTNSTFFSKNGISVPRNIDLGHVIFGQTKEHTVEVSNRSNDPHLLLHGKFHGKKSESQLTLLSRIDDGTVIGPGQTMYFRFRICGKFLGQSTEVFVFTFKGFKMISHLEVEVQDKAMFGMIENRNSNYKHKNTYAAARRMQFERKHDHLMKGVQPVKPPAFVPVKFSAYQVPEYLWNGIFGENENEPSTAKLISIVEKLVPCLNEELTFNNYCARFHALLYLEEIDLNIQVHKYDMEGVTLRCVGGEYLGLEIPGLTEKRPAVMVGDKINVFCPIRPGYNYEAYIHKICANDVWLKFHSHFHQTYNSEECSVHFVVSRGPVKRCHIAIDLAVKHLGEHFLFPKCIKVKEPQVNISEDNETDCGAGVPYNPSNGRTSRRLHNFPLHKSVKGTLANGAPNYCEQGKLYLRTLPAPKISTQAIKLKWFNPGLNHYQREAVRNAVKGEARPNPYVIFGPPGTGKTITLVETILQIYNLIPQSRILVATPSNSSANLIAERLLLSKVLCPGDLVRLVAYHCLEEGTVPESLLPYSTTCDISSPRAGEANPVTYKLKRSSNASVLGRHRITVGTCIALGQLYTMGFPNGHFTHVCVDEAGQATEPEVLIPLGLIHSDWGQAILAGDPLQLGPVVSSRANVHYGLGVSYLARLLESCPYRRDPCSFSSSGGYNPKLVTRLVMNYRSLPEILSLPSTLFYDSQLQPQITDDGLEGSILKSLTTFLPSRDSPLPPGIVFHGIRGVNYQDTGCPSWFNPAELVQIIYYLKDFLDFGLKPDDIGVITPYHKQVQELRSLLAQWEIPSPKIGSVEEFQGQERFVIILSTVRSTSKHLKSDPRHSLGFVASPQRLNVALTRARALLIIIGNPHLLNLDTYWRKTLAYCVDHNAYTGCDLPKEFMDFSCASSSVDLKGF